RAFVELELEEGVLAPGTGGPLGDYVAYLWIDRPSASQIVIEARVGDRPVVRREIGIEGLDGEVAARLVAIAATQMVRVQAQPVVRPKRVPTPRRPTPEELERAARMRAAAIWTADAEVAWTPGGDALVAGPRASLSFRYRQVSEQLF